MMKQKKTMLIFAVANALAIAYLFGYCHARANLRLVHRCIPGELPGNKIYLTSEGGHRVAMPMYGLGNVPPRTFEYYFYSRLRWFEGAFWSIHYRKGDQLAHSDPKAYR